MKIIEWIESWKQIKLLKKKYFWLSRPFQTFVWNNDAWACLKNTNKQKAFTFLPDLLKSASLSVLYKHLNTHIRHIKAKVPGPFAVKNMRITHRRHLFPLYCLGGYKTIFMFFCPLSNWIILKTSNNTWLDQTVLSAVQICFCGTFTKSSHRQTKHFTRMIFESVVVSNVLLTQSVGSKDVRATV